MTKKLLSHIIYTRLNLRPADRLKNTVNLDVFKEVCLVHFVCVGVSMSQQEKGKGQEKEEYKIAMTTAQFK